MQDSLDMEEGKKRMSIDDMKTIIEKEFAEPTERARGSFSTTMGLCIPYTNHEAACNQFIEYLVSMRDMQEADDQMATLPNDASMYWYEFVSVQLDWLKLFKRFAMAFDRPRDPMLDNQTGLMLWGEAKLGFLLL